MSVLTLHLKTEYWEAIKSGHKSEEYRLCCPYWDGRLLDGNGRPKLFDGITLAKGYPRRDDATRRLQRPWRDCVSCFRVGEFVEKSPSPR